MFVADASDNPQQSPLRHPRPLRDGGVPPLLLAVGAGAALRGRGLSPRRLMVSSSRVLQFDTYVHNTCFKNLLLKPPVDEGFMGKCPDFKL